MSCVTLFCTCRIGYYCIVAVRSNYNVLTVFIYNLGASKLGGYGCAIGSSKSCINCAKYILSICACAECSYCIVAREYEGLNSGISGSFPNVDGANVAVLNVYCLGCVILNQHAVCNVGYCYVLKICCGSVYPVDSVATTINSYVLNVDCGCRPVSIQEAPYVIGNGTVLNRDTLNGVRGNCITRTIYKVHVLNCYIGLATLNGNVSCELEVITVNCEILAYANIFGDVSHEVDRITCLCSIDCFCKGCEVLSVDVCYALEFFALGCATYGTCLRCIECCIYPSVSECVYVSINIAVATCAYVSCVTLICTCRSCYYGYVSVRNHVNSCLCKKYFVTYRALNACGKSCCCARRSYCINNRKGVSQCIYVSVNVAVTACATCVSCVTLICTCRIGYYCIVGVINYCVNAVCTINNLASCLGGYICAIGSSKSCINCAKYILSICACAECSYCIVAREYEGLNSGISGSFPNVDGANVAVLNVYCLGCVILNQHAVCNVGYCYVLKICCGSVYPVDSVATTINSYVLNVDCGCRPVSIQEAPYVIGNGTVLNRDTLNGVRGNCITRTIYKVHVLNCYIGLATLNGNVSCELEVITVNGEILTYGNICGNVSHEVDRITCLCSCDCFCKGCEVFSVDVCYCLESFALGCATYGTCLRCAYCCLCPSMSKCRNDYSIELGCASFVGEVLATILAVIMLNVSFSCTGCINCANVNESMRYNLPYTLYVCMYVVSIGKSNFTVLCAAFVHQNVLIEGSAVDLYEACILTRGIEDPRLSCA